MSLGLTLRINDFIRVGPDITIRAYADILNQVRVIIDAPRELDISRHIRPGKFKQIGKHRKVVEITEAEE